MPDMFYADRIMDTSVSTGTGDMVVSGTPPVGWKTFAIACTIGATFYYTIVDTVTGAWETGEGTYTATNTIRRDTVRESSAANARVSFAANLKNVFIDVIANYFSGVAEVSDLAGYLPLTGGTLSGPGNLAMAALTATTGTFSSTLTSTGGNIQATGGGLYADRSNDATAALVSIRSDPGQASVLYLASTTGVNRWIMQKNATAETGSNAGSNFYLTAYDDAGVSLGNAFTITRATLGVAFGGAISTVGAIGAGGGITTTGGNLTTDRTGDVAHAGVDIRADAGFLSYLDFRTGASVRWRMQKLSNAEGGSNAGSDFNLWAYDDAGASIGSVLNIIRSTRVATFGVTPFAPAPIAGATGNELVNAAWVLAKGYGTGSGGAPSVGIVPPGSPTDGQLWFNSDAVVTGGGQLFIRYNDGNTSQWVPASPAVGAGAYLSLGGGTLTGPLTGTTGSFSGAMGAASFNATSAGTGYQLAGASALTRGSYTSLFDTKGLASIVLGSTGDPQNYYRQTNHRFSTADAATDYLIMNATAATFYVPMIGTTATMSGIITGSAVVANAGAIVVERTGDDTDAALHLRSDAGRSAIIRFETGTSARYLMYKTNSAEPGSNVGSDFAFNAYSDTATTIGSIFSVIRATRVLTFGVAPSAPGMALTGALSGTSATFTGNIIAGASSSFGWTGRSLLTATGDGGFQFTNNAGTIGVRFETTTDGTLSLLTRGGGSANLATGGAGSIATGAGTFAGTVQIGSTSRGAFFTVVSGNLSDAILRNNNNALSLPLRVQNLGITAINQGAGMVVELGSDGATAIPAAGIYCLATDTWAAAANRSSKLTILLNSAGNATTYYEIRPLEFIPIGNGSQALGGASNRWSTVYAATGTINTSSANDKIEITVPSIAEREAARRIKTIGPKRFKFKDAVAIKGEHARWHVGYLAEDVRDALFAEGLDPWAYGMLCADQVEGEWRLGLRYDELQSFLMSAG